MRNNNLFWGGLIVLLGVLLLLGQLFPNFNAWNIFWPLVLIVVGVWFLFGRSLRRGRRMEVEQVNVPLADIRQARILFHHGAGRLDVASSNTPGSLVAGTFTGGVEQRMERQADAARLDLRARTDEVFFGWPYWDSHEGLSWNVGLTREIPLQLEVESGASETRLNLQDLLVSDLSIKTGASSTVVNLPANAGSTRVSVQSGAASVTLNVPQGVAGRIHVQSGLAGIHIDTNRFPATGSGYETPGYDASPNKVEIFAETGVASLDIR